MLKNTQNGHQIRNIKGTGPYFRGQHEDYGLYAWNIKYYDWQSEYEPEMAVQHAFGDHVKIRTKLNGNIVRGFEQINQELGRNVEAYIAGRSGGWLVINDELTESELTRIDEYVKAVMKGLPEFLKEERAYQAEMA